MPTDQTPKLYLIQVPAYTQKIEATTPIQAKRLFGDRIKELKQEEPGLFIPQIQNNNPNPPFNSRLQTTEPNRITYNILTFDRIDIANALNKSEEFVESYISNSEIDELKSRLTRALRDITNTKFHTITREMFSHLIDLGN